MAQGSAAGTLQFVNPAVTRVGAAAPQASHFRRTAALGKEHGSRLSSVMRIISILAFVVLVVMGPGERTALAQAGAASGLRIDWDVKNRFRLFRSDADFQRHVAAYRNDGVL